MKSINQLTRLLYINYVLAKNGLDRVVVSLHLFSAFRFIIYFNPWNWFRREKLSRGEALRKTLEELGPVFVKFGQALSTRPDAIPTDIILELAKLQDNVPPFPDAKAKAIIEAEYNASVLDVFAEFEETPFASASIAQVHAAKLKTGEDVVIKILRPNIKKLIMQDLGILHTIAKLADKYWSESKRLKPKEVVKEFERTLVDELDLRREAANAQLLKRNFNNSLLLYVPAIHWDYVRDNVLVMERIYGIPVTDIQSLKNHKINIKKLAERGLEIFFIQVFRDCFFHADMHPGNIFVSFNNPENPQYICVDFGIVGTLSDKDQLYLAENLLAFFNRDYRKVAELHISSGWLAPDTNIIEFENSVRTVCEPVFEKPLKDISFALLVVQLFRVAQRFNMQMQPQLVLLQKTLLAVEGLGRQLYPDLDIWEHGKPFLEKWVREQLGVKALYKNIRKNIPFLVEKLPYLPKLLNDVLELQKMHLQSSYTVKTSDEDLRNGLSKGAGFGIFGTAGVFSALLYFNLLSQTELICLALGAGLSGIIITLFNK